MESYNPYSLQGKTILITGASSGIGKATAIECSKLGATVIIVGRNIERLADTFKQLVGVGHFSFCVDLLDEDKMSLMCEQLPFVEGIVHSAGIADTTLFHFLTEDKIKNVFNINFLAPIVLTKQLLKKKKIRKEASIVFLSSIDGPITGHIGNSAYSASKGAISAIIKNMAVELSPKKIRVNAILPGQVETQLIHSAGITEEQLELDKKNYPLKRYANPNEIAWGIIYLLSDASSFTTGTNIVIDGGFTII